MSDGSGSHCKMMSESPWQFTIFTLHVTANVFVSPFVSTTADVSYPHDIYIHWNSVSVDWILNNWPHESHLDAPHDLCEFCNPSVRTRDVRESSARTHNFCEPSARTQNGCESSARTHDFCKSPAHTHDFAEFCNPSPRTHDFCESPARTHDSS